MTLASLGRGWKPWTHTSAGAWVSGVSILRRDVLGSAGHWGLVLVGAAGGMFSLSFMWVSVPMALPVWEKQTIWLQELRCQLPREVLRNTGCPEGEGLGPQFQGSLSFCPSCEWVNFPSHLACLHAAAAKSLQSCPTLCDPIEGSPPGSSIHGILQARVLEWAPFPSPGELLDQWLNPHLLHLLD